MANLPPTTNGKHVKQKDFAELPITRIKNTVPPQFIYKQIVTTPIGKTLVKHQGAVHPSMEVALCELIAMTETLIKENIILKSINEGFAERIAAQSELLSKAANKQQPVQVK